MALIGQGAGIDPIDVIDHIIGLRPDPRLAGLQGAAPSPLIGANPPGAPPVPVTTAPGRIGAAVAPAPAKAAKPTPTDDSLTQFQKRYADWQAAEPKAPNPKDYKPSIWRRLLGAASAGMVGYGTRNPEQAIQIGRGVVEEPLDKAESEYQQAEKAWQGRGPAIAKEQQVLNPPEVAAAKANAAAEQAATKEAEAERVRQEKAAADAAKRSFVTIVGPDNQPMPALKDAQGNIYDYATGEKIANPALYAGQPKEGKPVAGSVNNTPTWGIYDPQQGWLDANTKKPLPNFVPPASWAENIAPTRTTTVISPDTGLPEVVQYDPVTKTFSKPVGLSATGAYGHSAAQAGAITRAGANLTQEIEANRAKLGNVSDFVKKAFLGTPFADPDLQYMAALLASYAALNPAMHGFRGQNALEQFEKIVGGIPTNPDALIASIRAISETAGAINPSLRNAPATRSNEKPQKPKNTVTYSDGGTTYDIPKPKVGAFLKAHPNAKQQ